MDYRDPIGTLVVAGEGSDAREGEARNVSLEER